MNAKARLANLLDRIVECEGARRSAMTDGDTDATREWEERRELARRDALALLAEGVTLPEPSGPVTSEEAVIAYEVAYNSRRNGYLWFDPAWRIDGRHALDAAMPLLARDHKYIKLAEVERRAREWVFGTGRGGRDGRVAYDLVAALTAPEGEK